MDQSQNHPDTILGTFWIIHDEPRNRRNSCACYKIICRRGRRLVVAPHLNPHSAMQLTGPVTPPFRGGGEDTAFSFAKGSDDDVRLKRSKKRGRREEMSKQLAKANTPPFLLLTPSPFLPPSSVLTHSIDPECVVHRGVQAARGSICAARTNERGRGRR